MQDTALLNRAILGVLKSLDAKWQAFHVDDLTEAHERALRLLVRAGLAEYRLEVWASVDGAEEQGYVFRLSGPFDDELRKQIIIFHPEWESESLILRTGTAFEARLTISGVAERERMSGETDDGGFCCFLKSMPAAPAMVRCEGRADTGANVNTPSSPAGTDEPQQVGQVKNRGGRPPVWDKLQKLIAENPENSNESIVARFRQRFSHHPRLHEVDAKKVAEQRKEMNRKKRK